LAVGNNAYIKGFGYYGPDTKINEVEGWVDSVHQVDEHFRYGIQANDCYDGAKGTTIYSHLGAVEKSVHRERPKMVRGSW